MKLTTKGRYAVMAMADLASYSNDKPISLTEISLRQNISQSYLEQLFLKNLHEGQSQEISKKLKSLHKVYNEVSSKSIIFCHKITLEWATERPTKVL